MVVFDSSRTSSLYCQEEYKFKNRKTSDVYVELHKRLKLFYSKNNKKQVDGTSRRGVKGIFHNDPTKGTELF